MKSKIVFIGFVSIMLGVGFFSCSHDVGCVNEEEEPAGKDTMQMTLTVQNIELVRMSLSGIGLMTVDFGDGTPTVTYLGGGDNIVHAYSDAVLHAITITGDHMTSLSCGNNQLVSLDVSRNPMLTYLYCVRTGLTNLDVSKNTLLTTLDCSSNQLSALDLSKNTVLTNLKCVSNQLTDLDLSKSVTLTTLDCSSNQLTDLDLSKSVTLTTLDCSSNQLSALDLSKNTMLTDLYCRFNQLTNLLVVSKSITDLDCRSNQLTNLDVSKCTALARLNCSSNQLTNLDVSKCTVLDVLNCSSNHLTNLDVSKCTTALSDLDCRSNQLSANALNNTFKSLRTFPRVGLGYFIHIAGNPGSDTCDRNIATNKGWYVDIY